MNRKNESAWEIYVYVEEKYDISIITKCSITQTQDPGGNEFKID
jgi:hypothetical protein